ncbi:hypothetical protein [Micromonospora sp. NPDC049497]|uniref:hypothetical protein n=1 Tax=Micromonospora sp. NPDC049497 TaxID=3364273 RepID=UPI00379CCEAD
MNQWTEKVELPMGWVNAVGPRVCARHGEPAQDRLPVKFRQRIPPWAWIGAILCGLIVGYGCGLLGAIPVALLATRAARAKWPPMKFRAWPYCDQCFALHRRYVVGITVLVLGVATYLLGIVRFLWITRMLDDSILALMAVGGILALTGAVVGQPFSWQKLARAHVSRDLSSLQVEGHGRFAADVRAQLTEKRAQPQAADLIARPQPLSDYR